jgi:hypothetical protein
MNAGTWRMIEMLVLAVPTDSQRLPSAHPAVFTSTDGTFQFSYSVDFQVCTAGKMEPCRNRSYVPPCEVDAIVCAVYPDGQFEGTNFGAAAFQVREINSKRYTNSERYTMTPNLCVTPFPEENGPGDFYPWPEFQISAQHPQENIGGVVFVHGISGDAGMNHYHSVDLYRAFHEKRCYELSLSESWATGVSDPPMKTLTHAQQKDVDESLSQILHSFGFIK